MAKKKNNAPDIINNIKLCDSCQNCVTLNTKKGTVKTKHFSDEEYSWENFAEPLCKLTGAGMKNVSVCDKYKKISLKSVN